VSSYEVVRIALSCAFLVLAGARYMRYRSRRR